VKTGALVQMNKAASGNSTLIEAQSFWMGGFSGMMPPGIFIWVQRLE